jgi:hypothetical protein
MFLTGLIIGAMVGFPFVPIYKTTREENLGLEGSDKMLRMGGAVLYSGLLILFFLLCFLKN